MYNQEIKKKIIFGIGQRSREQAVELVSEMKDWVNTFTVGLLWHEYGKEIIKELRRAGARHIFNDLKLYEIPSYVRRIADINLRAGVDTLTVACEGGVEMMQAARTGIMHVLGVTVLSHKSDKDERTPISALVLERARLAKLAELTGVLCSGEELEMLRAQPELDSLDLVVAATRFKEGDHHDHARVVTPLEAMANGASHLIVGRMITDADKPIQAMQRLHAEMAEGMKIWEGKKKAKYERN